MAASITYQLTDGGDDRGGEIESARELPLYAGLVGFTPEDVSREIHVIGVTDVVAKDDLLFLVGEATTFLVFVFGFEGVEYGGAYEQVGERAHD